MFKEVFHQSTISSKWAALLNTGNPLGEYPRPQMVRSEWKSLNGFWDYVVKKNDRAVVPEKFSGKILVPFAIESALSGVEQPLLPSDDLWYRLPLEVPSQWSGSRILLHFEAVDWECECFLNRKMVGTHRGGYLPFSFDITDYLNPSDNELIVKVNDPTDSQNHQRGKQVLNPKKIYYTATSGIWQTVWIESVPKENHIISINIMPDVDGSFLSIRVIAKKKTELRIRVKDGDNPVIMQTGVSGTDVIIKIVNSRLWTPGDPFLYHLEIDLLTNSAVSDSVKSYFAFRKISLRTGPSGKNRIVLNGENVFLHAPLDQGYWPESGMTPPCDDAMIFDIQNTLDSGFNSSRKHIKIEPRRWYYHADRLGLMVLQDMISGGRNVAGFLRTAASIVFDCQSPDSGARSLRQAGRETDELRKEFENELNGMISHLQNHPSIIMWIPFNESWGQFDSERIAQNVKKADPSRLVDPISGWFDQGSGDFRSRHTYSIKLKRPPVSDNRIYFISEYGGYNLSENGHLWVEGKKFGYKEFKTRESLSHAYRKLIREQILPLIKEGLGAAVYTQLTDVEIETNGLFTYDRKVQKISRELLVELNNEIHEELERCEALNGKQ